MGKCWVSWTTPWTDEKTVAWPEITVSKKTKDRYRYERERIQNSPLIYAKQRSGFVPYAYYVWRGCRNAAGCVRAGTVILRGFDGREGHAWARCDER